MRKEFWLIIILAAVIVALALVLLWPKNRAPQGQGGLWVDSPLANSEVSSPIKITGKVTGDGWTGFEAQVGTVQLLDSEGNVLGQTYLPAITEWTTLPVSFEANLSFTAPNDGPATLVFRNENPSGEPARDKTFNLPVKIKKSAEEMITIKAYFNNSKMDPEFSCNKVFAAERQIPRVEAVGSAALWELLKGPTEAEKDAGFFTSINPGVKLQSLLIDENGTATADFDDALGQGVGGSCKVSAIRAEITETLKQFPTVKNVIISINGRTEDILQP